MEIIEATLFLALLAGVLSLILVVASRKFAVHEDPRIKAVEDVLPQYNCGACGFPGCVGFAQHMVETRDPDGLCTPGGPEVQAKISAILGMESKAAEPVVAHIFCHGDNDKAVNDAEYFGIQDCIAADLVSSATKVCPYGCLGLGSCDKACAFDAIRIENGLAFILEDKCIACGKCVASCPRNIIRMVPKGAKVAVECNSRDRGGPVKKYCSVGCITCLKCVKNCPEEAILEVDGNIIIDHDKCKFHGACIAECAQLCIHALEGAQLQQSESREESA